MSLRELSIEGISVFNGVSSERELSTEVLFKRESFGRVIFKIELLIYLVYYH